MQFASPTLLIWLLLAIPITAFYFLKVRLRRVPVSTVMFWDQVFDAKKPRSIWQRMRHLISLLLQLTFLGLLVFAVADPFFSSARLKARRIVLVVDNSASMQARAGLVTRLEAAKRRGERLIRGLQGRDQMAIVSAGTVARIESGLTNHQRSLSDALKVIPPTDGPTEIEQAVTMARRLLTDDENGQIVLLSDGCFATAAVMADEDNQKTDSPVIQLDAVGTPIDNVGITQFQVRRSLIDVVGYQTLIEVTSFSEQSIECRLELTLDEDLVDVIPLTLEPGKPQRRVFDHTSRTGGRLVANLNIDDGFATDNQATAILPRRDPQRVVLVTDGNLYLQSALAAIPLVQLETVTELPKEVPHDAILVLDGKSPEQLPTGNLFVVHPTDPSNLWRLGGMIEDAIVMEQEPDSDLMTHVQLENVAMPAARVVEIQAEHQVLARSIGGEPLYSAIEHADGKVLVLSVDLNKGDLALRTAFPIMMTNAVRWFRGERAQLQPALATGANVQWHTDVAVVTAAQSADTMALASNHSDRLSRFVLRRPDGTEGVLPDVDRLTLGPLDRVGIWQIQATKRIPARMESSDRSGTRSSARSEPETLVQYACNLSNLSESDLRPTATHTLPPVTYGGIFGGRPIWFYSIGLALLLSTLEWFLYQRRWIS